jgi:hypothetical protein
MKPKFDAKALLGAKKKSVGDIAKWARGGLGDQLRTKYAKTAPVEAEDGEGVEHEQAEAKGACSGEEGCNHCAEMKLLASISPDAIRKLLFNK